MHLDWNVILTAVVMIGTVIIRHSIKTPKDVDRAKLLAALADDIAAVVVNLSPNATWAQKLAEVITRLKTAGTVPTDDPHALERAATAALVRLGHTNMTATKAATSGSPPAR